MDKRIGILISIILLLGGRISAQDRGVTANIVSQFDEQMPVLSPDGRHLFYTIAHNEHNVGGTKDKGDIWYAVWQDSVWSMPYHGGSIINNKGWNGVIGFDTDGSMYLHNHYQDGNQGISIAVKKDDYWEKPVNVPIPYFKNKSQFQSGSISPDGKVILLSIESYGTIGAEDVYVLFKRGNKWTEPRNVGSVINTRFQEMTPVISKDGKTVYFSSNGLNGKGSMDVFKSTRLDDTWLAWSKPVNVSNVNSEGREQSFNMDTDKGMLWYVSTKDSDGYGDIKFVKTDTLQQQFVDTVLNSAIDKAMTMEDSIYEDETISTKWKLFGKVSSLLDSTSIKSKLVFEFASLDSTLVVHQNEASFQAILEGSTSYKLTITSAGYLPHIETIKLDSVGDVMELNYWLNPAEVGTAIKLDNVLFERGKAIMLPQSYPDLEAVVVLMNDNPNMEIELSGHTDNQGSAKLNFALSQERVEAVKDFLVDKGISSRRIEGKGYGPSRPIASNKNPETRKLNRRVEFTIMKE